MQKNIYICHFSLFNDRIFTAQNKKLSHISCGEILPVVSVLFCAIPPILLSEQAGQD
jgi:hypothetical protein